MNKKVIGIDLADLGENILSATHLAGKAVLSAFGAGAIAAPVEQLESPYLKDWARSTTASQGQGQQAQQADAAAAMAAIATAVMTPAVATVHTPDFVVTIYNDLKKQPDTHTAVTTAVVSGGKRLTGNGYRTVADLGKKFSFGYDQPQSVVLTIGGKKTTVSDVKQVLFMGGIEDNSPVRVSGDDPVAILEKERTMAESNNLNLNERERMDFERAGGGEEFKGVDDGSGAWTEIVGAVDDGSGAWTEIVGAGRLGTHPPDFGTHAPDFGDAVVLGKQQVQWNPPRVDDKPRNPYPAGGGKRPDPYTRVGAEDYHGGFPINYGVALTNQELRGDSYEVGAKDKKPKPAGGVRNPHGYKHGEYVFGDDDVLGLAMSTNPYVKGMLAQASKPLSKTVPTAASHAGIVVKTTPQGRKFTSLVLNRSAKHNPQKTLLTARQVSARAQQIGNTALKAIAAKQANTAAKRSTVLGATPKLSPGIAALKMQAQKIVDAGKKLGKVADKYEKVVQAMPTKAAAAAAKAKVVTKIHGDDGANWSEIIGARARTLPHLPPPSPRHFGIVTPYGEFPETPNKTHHVHGEILGDEGANWYEIIGAVEQACDMLENDFDDAMIGALLPMGATGSTLPDPSHPGYLMNGQIDPNYQPTTAGGAAPVNPMNPPNPANPGYLMDGSPDPNYGMGGGMSASGVPGPPDYGAGAVPTLQTVAPIAGQDFMPDPYPNGDDPSYYDAPTDADLPLGAVVFDGSQQPPFQGLGNYTVFWGQLPGSGAPKGGPNSGYSFHKPGDGSDSGWWLELMGTQPSTNYNGGHNFDHVDNFGAWAISESQKNNWGPLMGNPQAGWTKGLRYSPSGPSGPRWFWFFDLAPSWATQAIMQTRLNDAIVQYQAAVTAGQTDYVNAQLQDKLNAQQAAQQAQVQAASDAQLAMQQQQADAANAISQQQYEQQAQAANLQYAQQQAQQEAAQSQLMNQAQQVQLQYFQQHPEAAFMSVDEAQAAQQEQPSGDVEDGIDWGNSAATADEAMVDPSSVDDGSGDVSADDLMSEEG